MARAIGIVPAAGAGSRLWPFRATKELIQIGYETVAEGGSDRVVPCTSIDHVLRAMRRGGINDVFVVLSPAKWEVFRYLGTGAQFGLRLGYLCQEEPRGMPVALDLAYPFVEGRTVCLGMADTIVRPADCFARLLSFHNERRADLSLGVFATTRPQELAPVLLNGPDGRVLDIIDKSATPPVSNTWGIAAWSTAFTELLHELVGKADQTGGTELLLSDAFNAALRHGLSVYGLPFEASSYYDIGTLAGLIEARNALEPAFNHLPSS